MRATILSRIALATLLLATTAPAASAQTTIIKRGGTVSQSVTAKSILPAPRRAPQKAQAQLTFSYFNGGSANAIGVNAAETYDMAIHLPAEYAGMSLDAFAFPIYDPSVCKDVKAWVSTTLPATPEQADGFMKPVTSPVAFENMNEVVPDEPYTVPAGGCYIGTTFTVTSVDTQAGQFPVIVGGTANTTGCLYLRTSEKMPDWADCSKQGFGSLLTAVLLSGDFPERAAKFSGELADGAAARSGEGRIYGTVYNGGVDKITTLGYTVTDVATGPTGSEKTVELDMPIAFNESGEVAFPMQGDATTGIKDKTLTLTSVNGQPNGAVDGTSLTGSLMTLTEVVKPKIVEEEFTAVDCQYCTRGIAGMNAMEDFFPDDFIGIAAHSHIGRADPMELNEYSSVISKYSGGGLPGASLNRDIYGIDPYYGTPSIDLGIKQDIESLLRKPAAATVTVSPVWSEDGCKIVAGTNVRFLLSEPTAHYALAYVLVADSLNGPSYKANGTTRSNWWQSNYYGGKNITEPYLKVFADMKTNIPGADMYYRHVAIKTLGIDKGVAGSVAEAPEEDARQTYAAEFDVTNGAKGRSGEQLMQDKQKLTVVAMLIDTTTGKIINADKKPIASFTSGISSVSPDSEAKVVARYTLDGKRITTPQRGVNIVKYSDGRRVKVVY